MNHDHWEIVERILLEALEKPEADRYRYVCEASAGENAIRESVLRLLENHMELGQEFMDPPPRALAEISKCIRENLRGPFRKHEEYRLVRGGNGVDTWRRSFVVTQASRYSGENAT